MLTVEDGLSGLVRSQVDSCALQVAAMGLSHSIGERDVRVEVQGAG